MSVLLQRLLLAQNLYCNLSVGMLCLDCKCIFWYLGEVLGAVTHLAAVSWIKNCMYCKFTLKNLTEQPGTRVISNFCLTLCTYI